MFRDTDLIKVERSFLVTGVFSLGLVTWGTYQALIREGKDFSVFYHAWSLVLQGKGDLIYGSGPDRFLYAPSFAWLLSPLALLPESDAFLIWNSAKYILVLISLISFYRLLSRLPHFPVPRWAFLGGILLIARPFLIDVEYGQVNLLILSIGLLTLCGHFEIRKSTFWDFGRWFLLTSLAIAKIFALPLLAVPFVVTRHVIPRRLRLERLGIFAGFLVSFMVPFIQLGWQRNSDLILKWKDALLRRGLPLESHNQSFTALLYHYFSGLGTEVRSEGPTPIIFGYPWLSSNQIYYLSLSWGIVFAVLILVWIFLYRKFSQGKWISVLLGLLIIPSHLVWKPYFVMSLPLAILLILQKAARKTPLGFGILLFFFAGMNLTGFDILGHSLGAQFESASILLLLHILLLGAVLLDPLF